MARSTKKESTEKEQEAPTVCPTPTSSQPEEAQPKVIEVPLDENADGNARPTPAVTVDDDGVIQIA